MITFSIITPTILRESLKIACDSVSFQDYTEWQHIVILDRHIENEGHKNLIESIYHPQRTIIPCTKIYNNGGNTPRRIAWESAVGEWVFYLDCDNFICSGILSELNILLCSIPDSMKWAIFPITRLGQRFFSDPPGICKTDTMNLIVKREYALWPDTDAYCSDGIFVQQLLEKYPYASFPDFRPIAVIPKISFCK